MIGLTDLAGAPVERVRSSAYGVPTLLDEPTAIAKGDVNRDRAVNFTDLSHYIKTTLQLQRFRCSLIACVLAALAHSIGCCPEPAPQIPRRNVPFSSPLLFGGSTQHFGKVQILVNGEFEVEHVPLSAEGSLMSIARSDSHIVCSFTPMPYLDLHNPGYLESGVYVIDLPGGAMKAICTNPSLGLPANGPSPAIATTETDVVIRTPNAIFKQSLVTGERRELARVTSVKGYGNLATSGRHAYVCDTEGHLVVADLGSGETRKIPIEKDMMVVGALDGLVLIGNAQSKRIIVAADPGPSERRNNLERLVRNVGANITQIVMIDGCAHAVIAAEYPCPEAWLVNLDNATKRPLGSRLGEVVQSIPAPSSPSTK